MEHQEETAALFASHWPPVPVGTLAPPKKRKPGKRSHPPVKQLWSDWSVPQPPHRHSIAWPLRCLLLCSRLPMAQMKNRRMQGREKSKETRVQEMAHGNLFLLWPGSTSHTDVLTLAM